MTQGWDNGYRQQGAGIEAQSLLCPKCGVARPVRSKLLLVLPEGEKYAYFCQVCGAEVGSKMDKSQRRLF